MQQKKTKRNALLGLLAVLVVAIAVAGTVAWLTASDSVTNTFTVGQIKPPTTDEDGDPENPPVNPGDDETQLEGNIWEIYNPDSKIIPGTSITKRPFIGLGAGSEPAYVFAYVENQMMATSDQVNAEDIAHFTLGAGWKAVEGKATEYTTTSTSSSEKAYTGGLFVWCGVDGEGKTNANPVALTNTTDGNVWTGQLFQTVDFADSVNASDFAEKPKMNVYCYLYAAVNDVTYDTAKSAAEAWVTAGMPESKGTTAATTVTE